MPAAFLAQTLLETWRSGDRARLHAELERVGMTPETGLATIDSERVELLKLKERWDA